ncbi:MAG: MFS transporter [Acidobacteria bacterium]|nr:MFS transporter [Acidobacteriota bacterium]
MFSFPRAVWLLGWVSLATDAATEAIYPLLPFFLTRVLGAGAVSLGLIEGAAEAVNSVLKVASGRVADQSRTKRPLVLFGYGVSSLARPFIAITTSWLQVLSVRVLDRVGKGVRSAPRDAMLAAWTTPTTRGKVYGFHRAMDNLGAVVGPTLATLFLIAYPDRYRTLFLLTVIPGAIAVTLIFFVPEETRLKADATGSIGGPTASSGPGVSGGPVVSGFSRTSSVLPPEFTRFMLVLALFTLGNSTDAFLLLRLTDVAGTARFIPLMWAALHVVKATVSVVGGSWSDRVGRRTVIAIGWLVYALVYAGFAFSNTLPALLAWFLLYGFHFGFAEGTEKALVADLAPAEHRGIAFGIYTAVQGLGALAASVLFGVIWKEFSAAAAFGLGSALALVATALLFVVVRRRPIA